MKRLPVFGILGMAICVGLQLVDRFVVSVPDWLAIPLLIIAILLFGLSFYKSFRKG
jgi:uncharacterized protein (DUF983 family)